MVLKNADFYATHSTHQPLDLYFIPDLWKIQSNKLIAAFGNKTKQFEFVVNLGTFFGINYFWIKRDLFCLPKRKQKCSKQRGKRLSLQNQTSTPNSRNMVNLQYKQNYIPYTRYLHYEMVPFCISASFSSSFSSSSPFLFSLTPSFSLPFHSHLLEFKLTTAQFLITSILW